MRGGQRGVEEEVEGEGHRQEEEEGEEERLGERGVEKRRQEMGYCETGRSKLVKGKKREGAREGEVGGAQEGKEGRIKGGGARDGKLVRGR